MATADIVILALDLFGTMIFAITGAVKAIERRLDLLGVLVLACAVGAGGGMVRDCIIGATPVAALVNEIYLLICIASGFIVFFCYRKISQTQNIIRYADAIGLGVFTAIGAAKAVEYNLDFTGIVLSGVLTAIGGGVIRDIMVCSIPTVLKSDFYATAALIGGILYYLLMKAGVPFFALFVIVLFVVTGLRILAIQYKLRLPKVRLRK
ncbi:MAG: trimeric intracellular cation channel family protein [Lentisphaeria bacterium]|nr:trimeric intracellular cation channel family protein [Lentisphaeria bacterium]